MLLRLRRTLHHLSHSFYISLSLSRVSLFPGLFQCFLSLLTSRTRPFSTRIRCPSHFKPLSPFALSESFSSRHCRRLYFYRRRPQSCARKILYELLACGLSFTQLSLSLFRLPFNPSLTLFSPFSISFHPCFFFCLTPLSHLFPTILFESQTVVVVPFRQPGK